MILLLPIDSSSQKLPDMLGFLRFCGFCVLWFVVII